MDDLVSASVEVADGVRRILEEREERFANLPPIVLASGGPGLGKTYYAGSALYMDRSGSMSDGFLREFQEEIFNISDRYAYSHVYSDKPVVGKRKVDQARKLKDRARNRAARQARRHAR